MQIARPHKCRLDGGRAEPDPVRGVRAHGDDVPPAVAIDIGMSVAIEAGHSKRVGHRFLPASMPGRTGKPHRFCELAPSAIAD